MQGAKQTTHEHGHRRRVRAKQVAQIRLGGQKTTSNRQSLLVCRDSQLTGRNFTELLCCCTLVKCSIRLRVRQTKKGYL